MSDWVQCPTCGVSYTIPKKKRDYLRRHKIGFECRGCKRERATLTGLIQK